jgi:alkylation response protein AidB-like acyl-CoA dehydrogenase
MSVGDHASPPDGDLETVEEFRQRARTWIRANVPPAVADSVAGVLRADHSDEEELESIAEERRLQRMFFDAGLAGICFPRAYGGQGLTPAHQQALKDELAGHMWPARLQAPTFSPCASVILEFGTEDQKARHLPPILRGDAVWMQLLSEPSGGSDVAAALTTAVRDGDEWVLNGSKVWTTGAWWSDWGLCLARTNWDVPKHRGLSVFMFPLHQDGIDVHRIEMLNGSKEFCQEFLTDVRVPDADRLGEVDDGWTVGTRWMFHERMLSNSPYVTIPTGVSSAGIGATSVFDVARDSGRLDDPIVRDLVGEAHMLERVNEELRDRVRHSIATGATTDQIAAVGRLFGAVIGARTTTIAYEIAGAAGGAWTDDDASVAERGTDYLMRQVSSIGGGTTEMARNVISERVLGMPRERTLDRDVPFRDVPRSPSSS